MAGDLPLADVPEKYRKMFGGQELRYFAKLTKLTRQQHPQRRHVAIGNALIHVLGKKGVISRMLRLAELRTVYVAQHGSVTQAVFQPLEGTNEHSLVVQGAREEILRMVDVVALLREKKGVPVPVVFEPDNTVFHKDRNKYGPFEKPPGYASPKKKMEVVWAQDPRPVLDPTVRIPKSPASPPTSQPVAPQEADLSPPPRAVYSTLTEYTMTDEEAHPGGSSSSEPDEGAWEVFVTYWETIASSEFESL